MTMLPTTITTTKTQKPNISGGLEKAKIKEFETVRVKFILINEIIAAQCCGASFVILYEG